MLGNGIGGRDTKTMEGAEENEANEAKEVNEGIRISTLRR
jgi:hypothetical protein